MIVLGRVLPKVPAVLVAVVVAIVLSIAFSLAERGVDVVGPLDQGLPEFTIPSVGFEDLTLLLVGALGISLVALADTISTATSFAERQGVQVDGNREMIGIGTANVAAGLFQGFPVSTSGSRTAVAEKAGSRTQVTGLVGAVMIALMLIAFPDLLADLPQPTLAAVVIVASISLADIPATRRLYRQRRADFALSMAAFLGVVLLGVLPGIVLAIVLSVANVFRRIWWPYFTTLGRVDGIAGLHDVTGYPEAELLDGCTVLRFDAPLIFANAGTFREQVLALAARDPKPAWIVVAAEPITDVDTTACDMLEELVEKLDAARRAPGLRRAEGPGPAQDRPLRPRARALGDDRYFPTIRTATDAYIAGHRGELDPPVRLAAATLDVDPRDGLHGRAHRGEAGVRRQHVLQAEPLEALLEAAAGSGHHEADALAVEVLDDLAQLLRTRCVESHDRLGVEHDGAHRVGGPGDGLPDAGGEVAAVREEQPVVEPVDDHARDDPCARSVRHVDEPAGRRRSSPGPRRSAGRWCAPRR